MKTPEFTEIKGFEANPRGRLLEKSFELRASHGYAYERLIGYDKPSHEHDRVNLAFPRGSSELCFHIIKPKSDIFVDSSSFLWLPAHVDHSQSVRSVVWDNLALFPDERSLSRAMKRVKIKSSDSKLLNSKVAVEPRSALLIELLDRFFFEKIISSSSNTQFLYNSIIEEVLRIVTKKKDDSKNSSMSNQLEDPGFSKAIQFIEANLFSKLGVKAIAVSSRMSVATLFRIFQRELGVTPFEYIRNRRLDEAKALLKTRDYTVSDVSILVGYEDLSAFSKSFKVQFGKAPKFFKLNKASK